MRQQHEECDPGSGAEQYGGADQVQELEREKQRHRSSRVAKATRCKTMIGKIFSIGPNGSAHSR